MGFSSSLLWMKPWNSSTKRLNIWPSKRRDSRKIRRKSKLILKLLCKDSVSCRCWISWIINDGVGSSQTWSPRGICGESGDQIVTIVDYAHFLTFHTPINVNINVISALISLANLLQLLLSARSFQEVYKTVKKSLNRQKNLWFSTDFSSHFAWIVGRWHANAHNMLSSWSEQNWPNKSLCMYVNLQSLPTKLDVYC